MLIIALLLAIGLSLYAQFKVKKNYEEFSKVASNSGMTGAQVAKTILDKSGVYDVSVQPINGQLTDHYDPRSKTVRLSEGVYGSTSLSAVSIAAHEVGHAIQHNEEYVPLTIRSILAPIASFTSNFVMILIMVGFFFQIMKLVDIGIIFYTVAVLFQVITLPVEFNASDRALENLENFDILTADEISGSKKVLSAAALTYVGATAVSAIQLLRLIAMRNSRD